ncbi:MAG TPA: chromate resistance protein ChrB domain-containing protein [Burkholderiales bacterium]|nr:chromate resistance protein ChrB domain-containing protein [Burkholderiales bacterium]
MDAGITPAALRQAIGSEVSPLLIDVRRRQSFLESDCIEFSHVGERCSFDAFLAKFHLKDPALDQLALIVRGADTNRLDLAPQAAGLAAISLGLSRIDENDHAMLEHGVIVYDALYRWCKEGKQETHTWNPEAYK